MPIEDHIRLGAVRAKDAMLSHRRKIIEIQPPNLAKYKFLKGLAGTADIIDILSTLGLITVVGVVVSAILFVFDILVNIILFIELGKLGDSFKEKGNILKIGATKIKSLRKLYAGTLVAGRKIPGARKFITKGALKFSALRTRIMSNPRIKNTLRMVADFIPFLELWPWRYFGVVKMEKQEIEIYKAYLEQKKQEIELEMEINQAQQEIN